MDAEEGRHQYAARDTVFREQFQVVVMHVLGIGLDGLIAKLAPVIEIGSAAGSDRRAQVKLLKSGAPHEEPHVGRIIDLAKAVPEIVTLGHNLKRAADDPGRSEDDKEKHAPKIVAAEF